MNKDKVIEITTKLYRLTLLFPKKEPLRYKIREIAGNILANLTVWEVFYCPNSEKITIIDDKERKELITSVIKDLEVIGSYLEVAKWQNWVSFFDVLKVQEDYGIVKAKFEEETKRTDEAKVIERKFAPLAEIIKKKEIEYHIKEKADLNEREEKIIEVLKEKGKAQVWEISKVLPKVSKRTLRRDFVELMEFGLIERLGEKNNTYYKIRT